MFPTAGLFLKLLCPDYTTCRLNPCLFSHTPPVPLPGVRQSQPAPSTVPQKRAAASTTEAGPSKSSRTNSGPQSASTSSQAPRPPIAGPSSTPKAAPAARSALPPSNVDMGPPRIHMVGQTHTPFVTRQKLLTALYEQYLLNYASLPDQARARSLANVHAKAQETTLYNRSNKASYRQGVISALGRLKKRPPAMSEAETGTLEDDLARAKARADAEKSALTRARVTRYVSSKEILAKYDYMLEVPDGPGGDLPTEEGNIRKCDRCGTEWTVHADLDETDLTKCWFHFGRMVTQTISGIKQRVYSCCPSAPSLYVPCQRGPHVFKDDNVNKLHSRVPFVSTSSLLSANQNPSAKLDVVALDCELVYTTSGMALARLTVVGHDGAVLLDEHVRPQGALLDTNMRFSGVKEEDTINAALDVAGVREALGKFVGPNTIIVGHGLENDLKALRLIHHTVIDTAIIFPHPNGTPWRHALRNLTRDHLGKFIQEGGSKSGHSAVEDSLAALELLRFKMMQDIAGGR